MTLSPADMDAFLLGENFISIDALKSGGKKHQWKIGSANGQALDDKFLKQLSVNPVFYAVTTQQSVISEWEVRYTTLIPTQITLIDVYRMFI